MASSRRSLLLLVLAAIAATATAAVGDAPFVVAHKKVALSRPGPGVERLAVTLNLYNQGAATAYDVSLNDDSWPQEAFEIVSGSTSKIVEKLDPGASASHNFVLEPKVQGRFQGSPAVIKYRVLTHAALQEAYSTPTLPLDILAERPPQQKFEWAKRLVGEYGPLVSVVSSVGMFVYLVTSPSKSSAVKGRKKKR
ncbi:hypothetical protein PAHAL_3G148200 [Panicum hallii]|uniref:Translocon-associated protein subunit beta n=1 Tax=Panicum hallii TaxID=206008 RepID=A0A2S3H958_9POAL|nr:translocon-associated protein subunit beta-like [Panicum hallii]PAN17668.1 hypothetical protein PAHAL_3G148200 [Panicum hallii]